MQYDVNERYCYLWSTKANSIWSFIKTFKPQRSINIGTKDQLLLALESVFHKVLFHKIGVSVLFIRFEVLILVLVA